MKLNKKGFAISALLYGLLILFVVLVSSYLLVLSARKNRVDNMVKDIEDDYFEKKVFPSDTLNMHTVIIRKYENGTFVNETSIDVLDGSDSEKITLSSINKDFNNISCNPLIEVDTGKGNYFQNQSGNVDLIFKNIITDSICDVYFD